jgi:hypothetical protein
VVDVDDAEVPVAEERLDVRPEVDRDAVREAAAPRHGDSEALSDRALRAVRGDQVVRRHNLVRPAAARPDHRPDVVVVASERDQLRAEAMLGPKLARPTAQDRLQPDLGDEQPRRRAEPFDTLVVGPEEVLQLPPGDALDRDDRAALRELARGCLLDLLLQADRAEDLHRALVKRRGARMNRRADMPLHQQVRHPVLGEQGRHRQPHKAATDHQDGRVSLRHRILPPAQTLRDPAGSPSPMAVAA